LEHRNVSTGAIQQDAPDAAAAGAGELPDLNDPNTRLPRNEAMAAMVARRRESLAADGFDLNAPAAAADVNDEDANADDARAETARRELAAQGASDPGPGPAAAADPAPVADGQVLDADDLSKYRVRKKVNGVETIVTVEDVLRDAQKIDAADGYLARAKQTAAEAAAIAAEARRVAGAGVVSAPAVPENQAADQNQVEQEQALTDFIGALFQGDQATAREKLLAALNRSTGGKAAVDPEALVQQVEQRIAIKTVQDTVTSAVASMLDAHPEIAKSQALKIQADEFLAEICGGRALTEFSPTEIPKLVQRAGAKTMDWFRPGGGTRQLDQTLSDRRAQKQGIDELPRAATRAGSTVPAPRTTSDTIESMRVARSAGQVRKA
jgi:hypothetical protein